MWFRLADDLAEQHASVVLGDKVNKTAPRLAPIILV
jgi:hypothetical protein